MKPFCHVRCVPKLTLVLTSLFTFQESLKAFIHTGSQFMKSTKGHEMSPSLSKPLSNLHHKFVFNSVLICLCFIYTYLVPVLRCQKTQKRLVVYELNQKVIGHIGVKQLEQTFSSLKAKESIFSLLNCNPVTVCISV